MGDHIMFIDPGLEGTGIAIFEMGTSGPPAYTNVLRKALVKKYAYRFDWMQISIQYVKWVVWEMQKEKRITQVIIEIPMLWSGSLKSNTAARSKGNDIAPLFKLTAFCGMLFQSCANRLEDVHGAWSGDWNVNFISPVSWKGQLNKQAVHARILKAYGKTYREHEADAVGMGLAMQNGGKI